NKRARVVFEKTWLSKRDRSRFEIRRSQRGKAPWSVGRPNTGCRRTERPLGMERSTIARDEGDGRSGARSDAGRSVANRLRDSGSAAGAAGTRNCAGTGVYGEPADRGSI